MQIISIYSEYLILHNFVQKNLLRINYNKNANINVQKMQFPNL